MALQNYTFYTSYKAKGCENIAGTLKIPNKVSRCTSELFVYYDCDTVEKAGCADNNFFISAHCTDIDCQAVVRDFIDNKYVNIRTVDNVLLVDIKSFNWKRFVNFLFQFVNDINDFFYIFLILILLVMFFFYIFLKKKKKITSRTFSAPHFSSAPPLPSAPPCEFSCPMNTYELTYGNYDETKKISKNAEKECPPYSGTRCRACNFIAKTTGGLRTHITAMLNRTNSSKTIHSIYYKK